MADSFKIVNPEYYFERNEFDAMIWTYKRYAQKNNNRELEIDFPKESLKQDNFEDLVERIVREISESKINPGNIKIVIQLTSSSPEKTFTPEEWKKFVTCAQKYEKLGVDFSVKDIGDYWSISEVENANLKIDKTVGSIKEKNLSPLEQLMAAYISVKKRKYTLEDENQKPGQSRSIYGVLNSDKIVCVGYAELFTQIINQVGDKNIQIFENTVDSIHDDGRVGGHRNLIVKVKDEKYGVDGYYYLDPTWDSGNSKNMNYFMVPIKDIKSIKTHIRYRRSRGVSIGSFNAKLSDELIDLLLQDPTFTALAKERIARTIEKQHEKQLDKAIENYDRMLKAADYVKSKGVKYATDDCFLDLVPIFGSVLSDESLYKRADSYVEEFKQKQEKTKEVLYKFVKKKLNDDFQRYGTTEGYTKEQIETMYLEFVDACEQNENFLQLITCIDTKVIANFFKDEDFSISLAGGSAKNYVKYMEDYFSLFADELNDAYISEKSGYQNIEFTIEAEVENIRKYLKDNGSEFYDILEQMSEPLPISTLQNVLYEVLKKAHPNKPKETLFKVAKQAMEYNVDISGKHYKATAKNAFAESKYS